MLHIFSGAVELVRNEEGRSSFIAEVYVYMYVWPSEIAEWASTNMAVVRSAEQGTLSAGEGLVS